jgi:hypothetical protein
MKRILFLHLVALGIWCASAQPASAWVNVKFGIGLNFDVHCSGNCWPGWLCGHDNSGHDCCPPYVFAPFIYQPPNPAFFVSPPHFPEPVTPTYQSYYDGHGHASGPLMPNYFYPASYFYGGR